MKQTGNDNSRYPVEQIRISIDAKKTGERIRSAAEECGYTVKDLMKITGMTSVQAVYKWLHGKSIPSSETQIILCKVLGFPENGLIVYREEQKTKLQV